MTQGNDGSLSTIHSNSSSDVVHKIATYAIQAPERLPWEATVRLVASALDFVVFIRRLRTDDGQRRVVESIREVAGISEDGQLQTNELWGPDALGNVVRRHGVQVRAHDELIAAGWRPATNGWS
jgi:Flp pilus assembly CpaF family ATPase